MKLRRALFTLLFAAGLIAGACTSEIEPPESTAAGAATTQVDADQEKSDPVEFRRAVRVLWSDHVAWTRLFIVSAAAGLGDTDATAARLLQNQADIGDAVAKFY